MNVERGLELFEELSNEGIGSFYELGKLLQKENNAEKCLERSFQYFQKASKLGDEKALYEVGMCYRFGKGVKRDYKKAFELLKLSAEKGNDVGMYEIASMYRQGLGVEKDYDKALKWYL